jgi:serine/threonine-protein kinase
VALRIVLDALSGLHAAHELTEVNGTPLHLVHRDVSPPNLLVGVDGVTRVSDFGIARAKARLGMSTKRGELKGKVGYMAPEQLQSAPVDRRIDIYAVGVVLWELLTNHKAFRGESEAATMVRALEGLSQMPSERNPLVPHDIDEVCARALAREPAHRIPTAAALADELERAAHAARVTIASARTVGAFVKELSEADTKKSQVSQ